jgi:hypothetical protein
MSNDKTIEPNPAPQPAPKRAPRPKRKQRVQTDREARQAVVSRASPGARLLAGVILRVLAGEIGPAQASDELGKSAAQYYKLENRALEGLLSGCEPRPRGRQPHPEQELAQLEVAHAKLQREHARLQSLVRLLGKTTGGNRRSTPPATKREPAKKETPKTQKGKRGRKPTVRALRLAEQVSENVESTPMTTTTATTTAPPPADRPERPIRPGPPSPTQP